MASKVAPFNFDDTKSYLMSLFGQTSLSITDEQLEKLTIILEMLNTWNCGNWCRLPWISSGGASS